jgi:hypothetical protein
VQEDLASLGAVLFEMLTGRAPGKPARNPSALNRSLPQEVDAIVGKALGASGGYQSAVVMAAELRAVGALLDVRVDAVDTAAITSARAKRSRRGRSPIWLVALVLAALAAAAWWYFRRA